MVTGTLTGTHEFPDHTPKKGTVVITPSVPIIRDATGKVILSGTVKADLDSNGFFSVDLAATDDTSLDPVGVTYSVSGHGTLRGLRVVRGIVVLSGQTVDMWDVTPVDPDAPTYAAWAYGTGDGSGGLTPDADHPGFYTISGGALTPDTDHSGFYLIGA